jgi:hypothetical protein
MFRRILFIYALAAVAAFSQDAVKAALQQRIGEVKQSIAQNQAQLRQYNWTETTEISLKGDEKKRTQAACRYGPDGKVQKTPIGEAPPPKSKRGIKGKIIAKKIDEMKDYMDRVGSLVRRYVPPDPQGLQAAFQAGKATLNPVSGELVFSDYNKPGDKITVSFDPATKKIRSLAVATYLDEPKDVVTVNARFSSLGDGTNFVEETLLDATAKQIQVKTTNFRYQKVGV